MYYHQSGKVASGKWVRMNRWLHKCLTYFVCGEEHSKLTCTQSFPEVHQIASIAKVPFRVLRHFTHKASVTSVNAEANAHSADWLMSVFVNELAPPHVRSQQGQCVR